MKTEEVFKELLQFKKLVGLKNSSLSTYMYKMQTLVQKFPENSSDLTENTVLEVMQTSPKDIALIKEFVKYAHKKSYIDFMLDFIPIQRNKNTKKIEIFSIQEQRILEQYLFKNLNFFYFGILLTIYTGIRIGELAALKYSDIKGDILSISKTLQRIKNLSHEGPKTIVQIDTPKSPKSIRQIPLLPFLTELMKGLNYSKDNYILTGSNDFMEPRAIERGFEKILDECKISRRKFHTIRHTFATNALKKNMSLKVLSELLGHSSIKSTEVYLHLDFEIKKEAMEMFTPCYYEKEQANA